MQLIIKRAKEYRHGWSYRAYAWEIELDGKPMGSIRDQETLSFDVPGGEHLLEIWVEKLPRSSAHQACGRISIPAGMETIAFECKMIRMPEITLTQVDASAVSNPAESPRKMISGGFLFPPSFLTENVYVTN